jgi:hypothetical protein
MVCRWLAADPKIAPIASFLSGRVPQTIAQNRELEPPDFSKDIHISADRLNDYRADGRNPVSLLYQTGYLTIKDYDWQFRRYKLGFSNVEVWIDDKGYLIPYEE